MKLAQILATSPLPGGSPARLEPASVDPVAAGLTDISKAATSLSETASTEALRAQRLLAAAEREKEKHQQALDASTAVNSALDTLDQAEQTFKLGQRDETTGEITVAPLSSKDYMPAWLTLREKVTQDALAKATTPEAKLVTAKLLETPFRERQHAARKYSNDLYVGQYTVGVEDNLATYSKNAVLKPEEAPYWETRAQAELAMAQGVKGPEWARQRWAQWTEQVDTATVLRQSETDPEGAMGRLTRGELRLPQKRADEIAVRVGDKWDRQVRQQDAAQAKAQAEITKYQTEQYHADTSDLYANAVDGRANLQELEAWRLKHRGRAGVDEDFTRIRKAILEPAAKEAKPWKSDEATRARVVSEMERIQPSYTHEQLVNLNEQHLLNTEDLKWALGQRRRADEFQRTLGVSAEGLARTQAMQRHQQAEQELRIGILGPDSLFKAFDDKQERIYGQALRQLSSRSSAYGGREDPMTVKDELLKTFLPLAGRQTMMKATEAQAGLTFPTERALEDAYRAKRITPGYYREQQERFTILKQAEIDLKANAAQSGDDAAKAIENLRRGGKGAGPAAPGAPRSLPASPFGGMVSP